MSLTTEQKAALKAEIDSKYPGLGADNILGFINPDGSADVETWTLIPIEDQKIKLSKLVLLTYLTPEHRAGIRAMLTATSDAAQDFAMLYNADNEFWVNDLTFRGMVDQLAVQLSIPEETVTAIKRLGERKISRSEELIGRKVTVDEIREVLNG